MDAWLIYGANGYTGALAAEVARARGHKPVLAGRSAEKVRPLAEKLGVEFRTFGVEKPDLSGVRLVLHCAGPFSQTSRGMVDACLASRVHYLDVTGEIDVFEAVLARDAEARERGVVLLPGVGFDVVPSDCLAAMLKAQLPSATSLELAFAPSGRPSPGTLKTMIENAPRGGRVRRGGKIVNAFLTRGIPFADKPRTAMAIAWGDVATAFRSTGIPDITVYLAARPSAIRAARLSRLTAPVMSLPIVQNFLKARVDRNVRGPSAEERLKGNVQLWGRVSDGTRSVEQTLTVPEGYAFTAEAAVTCVERVLAGSVPAGALTPSLAFGAEFVLSLPGVRR